MKSNKIVLLGLFSVALLSAGAQVEAADVVGTANSKGVINFTEDKTGEIIDPNTPWSPLDPGEENQGGHSDGVLRLQYVPDFQFGDLKIKSGLQTINPKVEKFVEKESKKERFIPQFVQVTDMRSDDMQWRVKVKINKFTGTTSGHTLENTKLVFTESKLTNNIYDDVAARLLSKVGTKFELNADEQAIFETKANATTKGSISSLVLNKNGKVDMEKADARNEGVYLEKGITDVPKVEEYRANLTWTIEDAL